MTTPRTRARSVEPRSQSFTDEHGRICVRVPLANSSASAIIWLVDYERIKSAGVSGFWQLNSDGRGFSYVRAKRPGLGNKIKVARAVMGNFDDERAVRYHNGNRLDLRRPNLYFTEHPNWRPEGDGSSTSDAPMSGIAIAEARS